MNLLRKFKEVGVAMLPIVVIALILNFTVVHMSNEVLMQFLIGTLLVYVGQVIFLVGVDNSLVSIGHLVGIQIVKYKKIFIVLLLVGIFGFVATVADPDVTILSNQLHEINNDIPQLMLICFVGVGVGVYVVIFTLKTILKIKLKYITIASFIIIFVLCFFAPSNFIAFAFDSGGVTTGPITVPIILALGIGIASLSGRHSEDSFGVVSLSAIGPIIAVLILGIIFKDSSVDQVVISFSNSDFGNIWLSTMQQIAIGIAPITLVFLIFNFISIKLSRKKLYRIISGTLITYIGLVLFLSGVTYGFSEAGYMIGNSIGKTDFYQIIIPIGVVLGFAIAFTEPGVKVLGQQVELLTSGHIRKKVLFIFLAIGLGLAMLVSMLRVIYQFHILYVVVPGYIIILILQFVVSDEFVGIGFDSGAVASGPMSATFLLPIAVGLCDALNHQVLSDAYGIIALISLFPILMVLLLGLIYKLKTKKTILEIRQVKNDKDYSGLED